MTLTTIALAFVAVSQTFHLPTGVLSAICYVESRHNVQAVNPHDGGSASIGICQIKLATAQQLGFKGTAAELSIPQVNVFYAGKYLQSKLTCYDGDIRKAIAAYNAGKHRYNSRGLTMNRKYVSKVLAAWQEDR